MKLLTPFAIVLLFFSSCYYDNEEELYPNTNCDTSMVTYSGEVLDILNLNCMSCHSAAVNQGGVTLEGYANLKIYVDNGKFLGAIRHDSGFSQMPQGAPQLPTCNIEKIEAWINQGAPDN